jgi:hypothetical protein
MTKLRSKPTHIGPSIITLTLSLTAKEVCAITGEPHAADAWFVTKDGKPDEPLFKNLAPYKFKSKFENSLAKIIVGVNRVEIDCGNCTLNKLVFEPQSDGRTALKLKVQCAITTERTPVFLWLDNDADVLLQFGEMVGDEAQEELPLTVEEGEAEAPPSRSLPEAGGAPALN